MLVRFRIAEIVNGRIVDIQEAVALDYFFFQGKAFVPYELEENEAHFMVVKELENRFEELKHIDYNVQFD